MFFSLKPWRWSGIIYFFKFCNKKLYSEKPRGDEPSFHNTILFFHNIFERLLETLSFQVKIHLQLNEEDGVLLSILEERELLIDVFCQFSSLHRLSNRLQVA